MKNILGVFIFFTSFFCVQSLAKEKNGFFVGLGSAYAFAQSSESAIIHIDELTTYKGIPLYALPRHKERHYSTLSYEVLGGYKTFFYERLGVRGYVSASKTNAFKTRRYKGVRNDLAWNMDILYNFSQSNGNYHGVFFGVGLHYITHNKSFWRNNFYDEVVSNGSSRKDLYRKNSFAILPHLGYRFVYETNRYAYSFELGLKAPFSAQASKDIDASINQSTSSPANSQPTNLQFLAYERFETKTTEYFKLFARLVFSF